VLGAPPPLDDVTVPDLAPLDVAMTNAALEDAGLHGDFVAKKPETKDLEFKFAGQSPPPRTKVPRGTTITVSIYQKFEGGAVGAQTGQTCPLTPEQAQKAAAAFRAMNVVLQHPRCINCHGVYGDLHDNPNTRHPKPGGYIPKDAFGRTEDRCAGCHNLAGRVWELAPEHMFFTNTTDIQVCKRFKAKDTGANFLNHLAGDRLIQLAFEGKKGQSNKPAEPPPISHEAFLQLAEAWITAVYGTSSQQEWAKSFPGEAGSACGCDPALAQGAPSEPDGAIAGAAVWKLTESVVNPDGAGGTEESAGGRFIINKSYSANKFNLKSNDSSDGSQDEFTVQYDPPPAELGGGKTYKLKVFSTASYIKEPGSIFLGGGYRISLYPADSIVTLSRWDPPDPPGSACRGQAGWCGGRWVPAATSEYEIAMPTDAPDKFVIYQGGSLSATVGAFTYERVK
jgi:hypothetical protein